MDRRSDSSTSLPARSTGRSSPEYKTSEASQRLATAPGVGPLTAVALIAAVGDAFQFTSARHFAADSGMNV